MADTGMAGGIADIGTLESSDNLRDASVDPDEAGLNDAIAQLRALQGSPGWRFVQDTVDEQIAELMRELIVLHPHPQNIVDIARKQAAISTLRNFSTMHDESGEGLDMVTLNIARLVDARDRLLGAREEAQKPSAKPPVPGAERGAYLRV